MNAIKAFINKRSKREILLFKLLWITCCFCVCFEYFAYPSFLRFQAHKYSLKTQYNSQEIEDFFTHFNQTSLPYTQLLSVIQNHSQTLTKIQSKNEKSNYEITLEGISNPQSFASLLHSIASPSLLISSLFIHSNGAFKLDLKNQKILSLSPITSTNLYPQEIFDKFTLPNLSPLPLYTTPKPKLSLNLEAILNNKAKINGIWLKSGEELQGYILQTITPHSVTLHKDSHTFKLYLKEKRILQ